MDPFATVSFDELSLFDFGTSILWVLLLIASSILKSAVDRLSILQRELGLQWHPRRIPGFSLQEYNSEKHVQRRDLLGWRSILIFVSWPEALQMETGLPRTAKVLSGRFKGKVYLICGVRTDHNVPLDRFPNVGGAIVLLDKDDQLRRKLRLIERTLLVCDASGGLLGTFDLDLEGASEGCVPR